MSCIYHFYPLFIYFLKICVGRLTVNLQKAAKRKKIHAFKSKVRVEQLENAQNKRQNAWQQFQTTKGSTKKVIIVILFFVCYLCGKWCLTLWPVEGRISVWFCFLHLVILAGWVLFRTQAWKHLQVARWSQRQGWCYWQWEGIDGFPKERETSAPQRWYLGCGGVGCVPCFSSLNEMWRM